MVKMRDTLQFATRGKHGNAAEHNDRVYQNDEDLADTPVQQDL
jgi:hypothetical protein